MEKKLQEKMEKKLNGCSLTDRQLSLVNGGLSNPNNQTTPNPLLRHNFVNGICTRCKMTYGAYAATGCSAKCLG